MRFGDAQVDSLLSSGSDTRCCVLLPSLVEWFHRWFHVSCALRGRWSGVAETSCIDRKAIHLSATTRAKI
jgi:hypothetical protein